MTNQNAKVRKRLMTTIKQPNCLKKGLLYNYFMSSNKNGFVAVFVLIVVVAIAGVSGYVLLGRKVTEEKRGVIVDSLERAESGDYDSFEVPVVPTIITPLAGAPLDSLRAKDTNSSNTDIGEQSTCVSGGVYGVVADSSIYFDTGGNNPKIDFTEKIVEFMNNNCKTSYYNKPAMFFSDELGHLSHVVNWQESADMDGDGENEIALAYKDGFTLNGWMFGILDKNQKNGRYEMVFKFLNEGPPVSRVPIFYEFNDVDGDGGKEVFTNAVWCNEDSCFNDFTIVQNKNGKWKNIMPGKEAGIFPLIKNGDTNDKNQVIVIKDVGGDGVKEIYLKNQKKVGKNLALRTQTFVYNYNPEVGEYKVVDKEWDERDDLYFLMMDAYYALREWDALKAKDVLSKTTSLVVQEIGSDEGLAGAKGLESLRSMGYQDDNLRSIFKKVTGYIGLEFVLTVAMNGGPNGNFESSYNWAKVAQKDSNTAAYGDAVIVFLDKYKETKSVVGACEAMKDRLVQAEKNAVILPNYEYAEERIELRDMCPLAVSN